MKQYLAMNLVVKVNHKHEIFYNSKAGSIQSNPKRNCR
jgi:hypothetical protein